MDLEAIDSQEALIVTRIAGIDKQKFNELVALGQYPCAPPTTRGVGRTFAPLDTMTLMMFVEMTDSLGLSARRAGKLACLALEAMRKSMEQSGGEHTFAEVHVVQDFAGGSHAFAGEIPEPFASNHALKLTFNIMNIVEEVARRIEIVRREVEAERANPSPRAARPWREVRAEQ